MRRTAMPVFLAVVASGAVVTAAAPAHASTCDPGEDIGPVALTSLSRKDAAAARSADVNRNGLVCGQTYYNARTGKRVGVHWGDDQL